MTTQEEGPTEAPVEEAAPEEPADEASTVEEVAVEEAAISEAAAEDAAADGSAEGATAEETGGPAAGAGCSAAVISSDMPDAKILDPTKLRFYRADDGTPRLEITEDRTYLEFRASRLFPVSQRLDYLSITDGGGDEIGVLRRLRDVPKPMRRVILQELRRRYFAPQITRVHSLKDEYGILYWDVDTTRGRREFVVREVRENLREFRGGRMLITDVDGNYFEIQDLDQLPGKGVGELYRLL